MSAQTGEASPEGPASTRMVDVARFRFDRLKKEPNPLWIRELKQSARLARTPIILTAIAILMTLMISSIGGIISADANPAQTGQVIFQVFFSMAYFVVTLVGPAVAANSIASEREGRTWEAVLLTGLSPATIARGKFLAAYTAIGMYIVMLAPVGALCFIFGGITATEVVVAFFFLFLIALLSVAFGLAVSSKMASLRAALLVTLLLAFPTAIMTFFGFGVGLSVVAHRAWFAVPEGMPVWLPLAYQHAPFDAQYFVFLIAMPIAFVALPAWFLYEVTIANLTSASDDHATGIKIWFIVAAPVLALALGVPLFTMTTGDRWGMAILGLLGLFMFFTFAAFLFQGDPLGASRRVKMHWQRAKAGALRRFLGPGVVGANVLLLAVGLACLGIYTATAFHQIPRGTPYPGLVTIYDNEHADQVLAFAGYAAGFFIFTSGLAAFLRARAATSFASRVLLFTFIFAISVGPWIIAAIAGLMADRSSDHDALLIASPSPFYVIVMIEEIRHQESISAVTAGVGCAIGWALIGFLLLMSANRRASKIIVEQERTLIETDRILAAEDEAIAQMKRAAARAAT